MTIYQVIVASPTEEQSEMSCMMKTLKYHYMLKVYLPVYRMLHTQQIKKDSFTLPFQSRRNDREEIRRKLAMGGDEDYYGGERMFKKPNLQTRLQGMFLI